jgi:hypothetical protein
MILLEHLQATTSMLTFCKFLITIKGISNLIMNRKEWVAPLPSESAVHVVDNLLLYQAKQEEAILRKEN